MNLGQTVIEAVKPLFGLFQDDGFAPAISLYLLIAAVFFIVLFFVIYVIPVRAMLRRKAALIMQSDGVRGFAERIDEIEKNIRNTRRLDHAWCEFRETLIEPRDERDPKEIRNTVRPQAYFNAPEAGLRFPIFKALPNLFVGTGLLLTFFGLVSALAFATDSIAPGASIEDTQKALRNLLHAASFKFYTSVAGIAASIMLGLALRLGISLIDGAFETFCTALEARLIRETTESIADDQRKEAREQTKLLKLFTTDVAISVGRYVEEALNKTLPLHLAQAMEPVADKIGEVTGKLTQMNQDALQTMANGFGDKLHGAAGEQFKALGNVLQELKGSLDGISGKMNSSGEELATRIRQSSEDMRSAVQAMTGALNEIAAKVEKGASTSSDAINSQIEASRLAMAEMSQRLADSIEVTTKRLESGSEDAAVRVRMGIEAAANGLNETSARMTEVIGTAVTQIAKAAETASEGVATRTQNIGTEIADSARRAAAEASAGIKDTARVAADTMKHVVDDLNQSITAMNSSLGTATNELRELQRGIATNRSAMEGIATTAKDTESAMSGAAKAIREASAPLSAAGLSMAESTRRLTDTVQGAVSSIQTSEQRVGALTDRIGETLEQLKSAWSAYDQRFADVDKSLETALMKILQHVQDSVDRMQRYVVDVDAKLSVTIDRLGGGISELEEFSINIERAVNDLRASLTELKPAA